MSLFVLTAGCMVLAALACVLVPLWRAGAVHGGTVRSRLPALVLLLALPALAASLYVSLGTLRWPADSAAELPPIEDMVAALEERLAGEPRDLEGWIMLGRSYVVMQRYLDAARAYERAYALSDGRNAAVITAYAEALTLNDAESLEDRAGELFDAALALEPNDPKALWYGGLSAYVRGQPAAARDRWTRLRALRPPEAVDQLLAERLADLDRRLGAEPIAGAEERGADPASAAPGIDISISVDAALRDQLDPTATLFVFARAAEAQGPPVAVVRRTAAELPLTLRLTDADAMLPGRKLTEFATLRLVARLSPSDQPLAASGDLFGEADYRRDGGDEGGPVELTIDRVTP